MNTEDLSFGIVLFKGALWGGLSLLVAYAVRRYTAEILAALLAVAALAYVIFSARAHAGGAWLAIELVGLAIYGGLALRGLRGSRWWLVAGWALHPVWDMALHHLGPGDWFAPDRYEIACLSFDWLVALVIAARGIPAPRTRALEVAA
jgi:hypothetical protein